MFRVLGLFRAQGRLGKGLFSVVEGLVRLFRVVYNGLVFGVVQVCFGLEVVSGFGSSSLAFLSMPRCSAHTLLTHVRTVSYRLATNSW